MHGYLLQSIIEAALGPFRRLSWGTLYPLLERLKGAGWIAVDGRGSEDGRGTKQYRTTATGRARFFELMRRTGDYGNSYRELFRIKLSNFGHLERDDQRLILADYRAYLAKIATHSDAMAQEVLKAPGLAVAERPYVLEAIDHQRYLAHSEIAWVDSLMARTGGKDVPKSKKNAGGSPKRIGSSRSGVRASARRK